MTANPRLALCAGIAALFLTGHVTGQSGRPDAIVPFKIHVPDAVLTDLQQRLSRARLPDAIPDTGWDYGTNTAYLNELIGHWRTRYDWRAQERKLNQFDHFKTTIDGLDIHFIHQRSRVPTATPVLLLNGWPSSFVEYTKVIGPLVDPAAHGGRPEDAVHVVVPSLPGFGFSDKPRERGYNPARMARTMAVLMARLGYTRYVAHGSDWGFGIATHLAVQDAAHVAGIHLATCQSLPSPSPVAPGGQAPVAVLAAPAERMGYVEIQSTKPQTLGHGLSDSPVGLASWILEKWYSWSDHEGDVEKVYTKDELLTNIMVYWVTNTGTSSTRVYYEARHQDGRITPSQFPGLLPEGRVNVPTGCGIFSSQFDGRGNRPTADLTSARRAAAETRYRVVHFASMPRGGHFPAMEQPTLWVDDIRAFFRELKQQR